MSRIRTIKPDFWTDDAVAECSPSARLLFIGTWNFADDHGNLDRSSRQLKAKVFPNDSIDCEPLVVELISSRLLVEYSANGKKYLHIRGFAKHQRVDKPSKPQVPLYEQSMEVRGKLAEDSPSPRAGREGKGREKEEEKQCPVPPDAAPLQDSPKNGNGHTHLADAESVLVYLNRTTGHCYRFRNPNGKPTPNADVILARLREGYSAEQLREVVQAKAEQWRGDAKMAQFLRPETLFGKTKFSTYVGELDEAPVP